MTQIWLAMAEQRGFGQAGRHLPFELLETHGRNSLFLRLQVPNAITQHDERAIVFGMVSERPVTLEKVQLEIMRSPNWCNEKLGVVATQTE
mmetsp:Transcript_11550/g.19795  ORF Transcript_11550/g.19795 Transcript_11550/m.19795 type:complete len:91 (-) Transcript_11550:167-439(-)